MNTYKKYYIFSVIGTFLACSYPIYMGIRVISDMITNGTVMKEDFPKYIIPYTPIAIAVIFAVAIMPLLFKHFKRFAMPACSVLSVGVFFIAELLFESKVIVTTTLTTTLESWQMFMCYQNPEWFETREWTAVDILMGEYSPTFKIHFYLISVVLIIGIINCVYGFGRIAQTGDKSRQKALVVQSVSTALFLGLCILACFTAFFRDGEIKVSLLSAFLMGLFFVVLGVTAGIFVGSFLLEKKKMVSILIPSVSASLVTLAMYIGEMFLLSGNLYILGTGFFFDPIPGIVLSLADIAIILLSGAVTALILKLVCGKKQSVEIAAQGE